MARSDEFLQSFLQRMNPDGASEPEVVRAVRERWREAGLPDEPVEGPGSLEQVEILAATIRELAITGQSLLFLQRRRVADDPPFAFRIRGDESQAIPRLSDVDARQITAMDSMVNLLDDFLAAARREDRDALG